MLRVVLVSAFVVMPLATRLNADIVVRVGDDFDSYPLSMPISDAPDWTGNPDAFVTDQPTSAFWPHTPPHFLYLHQYADAAWDITMPDDIVGLTLDFYGAFQTNSDPHLYLSPDGVAWTEITDEFGISKTDTLTMTLYSADLTSHLQPAGIQQTTLLRWTNTDPTLPSWYVIGIDSVEAQVTYIPEPATLCLLALGSLAAVRRRR